MDARDLWEKRISSPSPTTLPRRYYHRYVGRNVDIPDCFRMTTSGQTGFRPDRADFDQTGFRPAQLVGSSFGIGEL